MFYLFLTLESLLYLACIYILENLKLIDHTTNSIKKMKILLATNNKHKAEEFAQIFDELGSTISIIPMDSVTDRVIDVEEDGDTLEENAFKKAKGFYDVVKMPTIADDTGLEVDALGGLPGTHSARFAGEDSDSAANRTKLLDMLSDKSNRKAQFRTVLCYYDGVNAHFVEGICEGSIIATQKGVGGFGYDCIFIPDRYEQTFAEMPQDLKNSLSHRRNAINKLIDVLGDRR